MLLCAVRLFRDMNLFEVLSSTTDTAVCVGKRRGTGT